MVNNATVKSGGDVTKAMRAKAECLLDQKKHVTDMPPKLMQVLHS
jgi:hypothetical protein